MTTYEIRSIGPDGEIIESAPLDTEELALDCFSRLEEEAVTNGGTFELLRDGERIAFVHREKPTE